MSQYTVEMVNITKKFGDILANNKVCLQLKKGEIHALLGENGAGKSTLMSILFGLYQPDEGYIKKVQREIEKMLKNETKLIPNDIDYDKITNIASEARQKLKQVRPISIGQASRISGVNPADISILLVYLRRYYNE